MYQISWQHCSLINRHANLPPYWPQYNHLPPHFWLHKLPLSTFSFENPGVPVRALHQHTKSCTPHPSPCAHIRSCTAITSLMRQIKGSQGSGMSVVSWWWFAWFICSFFISLKLREDEVCRGIVGCIHKQGSLCFCCKHAQVVGNQMGLKHNSPPQWEEDPEMIKRLLLLN